MWTVYGWGDRYWRSGIRSRRLQGLINLRVWLGSSGKGIDLVPNSLQLVRWKLLGLEDGLQVQKRLQLQLKGLIVRISGKILSHSNKESIDVSMQGV